MRNLIWSELYSVYNPELDEEHKKLFGYINLLEDASYREITSREFLAEIAQKLVDYADTHFRDEEEYMKQYGYPDFEAHHQEHLQFTHDVRVFQQECNKDHPKIIDAMTHYLKNWLINHILSSDRKYAQYIKNKK